MTNVTIVKADRAKFLADVEAAVAAYTCKHCGKARADASKRDYETGLLCYPCWAMAWAPEDDK